MRSYNNYLAMSILNISNNRILERNTDACMQFTTVLHSYSEPINGPTVECIAI